MKNNCILIFICFCLLSSCKTEIERYSEPENLISPAEMVKILEEITVLESYVTSQYPQIHVYQQMMRKSGDEILKAHKVTFKQFEESINYYGSRQEEMQQIYEKVQNNLTWKLNHLPPSSMN